MNRRILIIAVLAAAFLLGPSPAGAIETSYMGETINWEVTPGAPGGFRAPTCTFNAQYYDGSPAYICDYWGIYPFVWEPMRFSASATPAVGKMHMGTHISYDSYPMDAYDGVDDWLPGYPVPTFSWDYDTIFWLQYDMYSPWKNTAVITYTTYNEGPGGTPVDYFRLIVRVNLYHDEDARLRCHDLRAGPPDWYNTDFCGTRSHPDDPRFERFRLFRQPSEKEGGGPGG